MTDRVELTDAEREALLFGFGIRFYENADHTRFAQGVAVVESIVAARVAALTAERDRLRVDTNINADEVERQRGLLDLARAELAAANARCAELEAMDDEWQRRVATLNSHGERAELISERNRATRERDEARSEAQRQEAQKTELRATLDRISALADECEKVPPANAEMNAWQRAHAAFARSLRAALTPEGTE